MVPSMANVYESAQLLSEYLLMHYGTDEQLMPWEAGPMQALGFPVRTVAHFPQQQASRGLDLGCSVGRSAFELTKTCDEVIGIDYSASFVDAAETLRRQGSMEFSYKETGNTYLSTSAKIPDGVHPERVEFLCGDATNLPDDLGQFDRVHAANLICRLPKPARLLKRLPDLVAKGGYLVLATPCSWLETFTPLEEQPDADTFEWISGLLSPSFELIKQADEPFLIRETARKFQWGVSMVSVWRRI